MTFRCAQEHDHPSAEARDFCDARFHDARSLLKMSRVGFAGPRKLPRLYDPPLRAERDGIELLVFSEEEIVPWAAADGSADAALPTAAPDDEDVFDDEDPGE